jgi:endonuclease/exonuclease/phosphatase (EEP) superfamily protein YafD
MAAGALLPSWLGLLGGWSWILDLFAHFRWQYLFVSVIVLGIATWRRARWIIAAAGLTLLLNGLLIGAQAWRWQLQGGSPAAGSGPGLSVVALNVLRINSRKQDVLAYLRAADADVIVLLEVDQSWMQALQPLQASHPHQLARLRNDNFGIALFSRIALADSGTPALGEAGLPSIVATLRYQERELVLIGTHPPPPVGARLSGLRDQQLRALAARVEAESRPVLLVGDLNATPWSHGVRRLTSGRLAFRGSRPWVPTWRAGSVLAVPIDHALCTAPLVITAHEVGPDVGSDHRPVAIRIGWAT